ncbi:molybdenum cofactor biosynthesis protein MoaE [Hwanghaeella grinnelliae]|uniref:Molybdopterin synthase catalytic subunit n=1 Tax=Hwanghaeella grinnelliae TaxID=2500179 RepID=A0A437QKC6_9PROT|nr:molybdenum cofactor biosynthesis protein MoaE [Hwanghaeella grinnelliae]RVU34963.1 molybdenum cofactor biosynthesis protein MoaE [Hwanghaeella grinnelliae]
MAVRVQRGEFDVGAELKALTKGNPQIGGLCAFTGLVRDVNDGASVSTLTLEHYPGMTEKMLERIEAEANKRWDLEASLIIHRYGTMNPEEVIVLTAAASSHRGDAFAACQFMMDYLKTEAPFWKVEDTGDGTRWVDSRDSDQAARERWKD